LKPNAKISPSPILIFTSHPREKTYLTMDSAINSAKQNGDAKSNGTNGHADGTNGHVNGTNGHSNGTWKHSINVNNVEEEARPVGSYPATGIQVLVVGTGLAGLTAAIECVRKGHSVKVLERMSTINTAGK
jgi:NADPH-dependent 2,4-dienoyl-CoA reductase/sulfur reductase-like enzyme